jgi:hypothetical protein
MPPVHSAESVWRPSFATDVSEAGFWIDHDASTVGILIAASVTRRAELRDHREVVALEPVPEIELLSMRTVGMDSDFVCGLYAKRVHGIGDHHRALIEVVLVLAQLLALAVGKRRELPHQIFKIHVELPPFRLCVLVDTAT